MIPAAAMTLFLHLPVFGLVAARLAGLIMFQPLLGGLAIPAQVRALLVIGLAALATPFVRPPESAPEDLFSLTFALASELTLGFLLGLVLRAVFLGVQYAGELIAQESGVSFGEIVDPNNDAGQSVIAAFYQQLATLMFLIVGGHRVLIAATLDTFDTLPLLSGQSMLSEGFELLSEALGVGLSLGIRIGAPVLVTLFLTNVALGFLGRTVPQLNILTLGFSIKGMLAILLMAVALPAGMEAFLHGLMETVDAVDGFLK